ncbi:MAG: hypothetical protein Q7J34_04325 [Bacteroidales bacterium]|nr:hypothetical protein [Bacteroidales bacterium]
MNTVGNEFFGSINLGGTYFETNESIKVVSNVGGLLTLSVKSLLPINHPLTILIPKNLKDSQGNLDTQVKVKNTADGILDYTNSDAAPQVLVKYNASVGDKYILKKSNGQTITRTVTAKSTEDDYPYAFMYIKVITVEQDSRIPGVKKIVYHANHKFGLVGVSIEMEDGTSSKITLMSKL